MHLSKPTLFLLGGLVLGTACSDDTTGGGNGPIAADQIDESLAALVCDVSSTCQLGDNGLLAAMVAASDKAACRAFFMLQFDGVPRIEADIAAGRISYDAASFAECLATSRATCDFEDAPGCRDVFHGKTALGAACTDQLACAGDAYCKRDGFDQCGVCAARSAIGKACDAPDACSNAGGLARCDYDSSLCRALASSPDAALDGPCGDVLEGDSYRHANCAAGLLCDYDEARDGRFCVARLAPGVACDNSNDLCGPGHLCLGAEGATTCKPVTIATTVGAACDLEATPAVACNAVGRLTCVEGACQPWPAGTDGDPCEFQVISGVCADGFYCSYGEVSVCRPIVANGAPCSDDRGCTSDFCGESGTCEVASTCSP